MEQKQMLDVFSKEAKKDRFDLVRKGRYQEDVFHSPLFQIVSQREMNILKEKKNRMGR
jgi:hypothetical protein